MQRQRMVPLGHAERAACTLTADGMTVAAITCAQVELTCSVSERYMYDFVCQGEGTFPSPCCSFSTVMVKMEWERLESWFIKVAPTLLFFLPTCTVHLHWDLPLKRAGILLLCCADVRIASRCRLVHFSIDCTVPAKSAVLCSLPISCSSARKVLCLKYRAMANKSRLKYFTCT